LSRAAPLLIFGITLFVGGLYWALWNSSKSYLDFLVVDDAYYQLAFFIWRIIPVVMLVVGIICIIVAGIGAAQRTEVVR